MKQKEWIAFIESDGTLFYGWKSDGVPRELVTNLIDNPPQIDGDTALARFYASGLDEQHDVELMPMPGSTFTRATFEKHIFGAGINSRVVIVGWYW